MFTLSTHHVANVQGQNVSGPIQPTFYYAPGPGHQAQLAEVKLPEPVRNEAHTRMPSNPSSRWPLLNEPRANGPVGNGRGGHHQSFSMPMNMAGMPAPPAPPAPPTNYLASHSHSHSHSPGHNGPGQDAVRFFYMNPPPVMMSGPVPRPGPGRSPSLSFGSPFQGPLSLPMTQMTQSTHPIPAPGQQQMQTYGQSGQGLGQGQSSPGLLPYPFPNQSVNQQMSGNQFASFAAQVARFVSILEY